MKKKRYSEEQIIGAIKQHESGVKVEDICRQLGISNGTFYNWRSKYAGLENNETKRLKVLESENGKLKKLLVDKLLEVEAMKDDLSRHSSDNQLSSLCQFIVDWALVVDRRVTACSIIIYFNIFENR